MTGWLLDDSDQPFKPAASRGIGDEFQARVRQLTLDSSAVGVRAPRLAVFRGAVTKKVEPHLRRSHSS